MMLQINALSPYEMSIWESLNETQNTLENILDSSSPTVDDQQMFVEMMDSWVDEHPPTSIQWLKEHQLAREKSDGICRMVNY